MEKTKTFEYILYQLLKWYGGGETDLSKLNDNDFSILKVIKLHFFVCAASSLIFNEGDDLLNDFTEFYALPYGPVELDIYNAHLDDRIPHFEINTEKTIINSGVSEEYFREVDTNKIDRVIEELKSINDKLVYSSATSLVDISHKWDAWILPYNNALQNDRRKEKIDEYLVRYGTMFFG